VVALLLAGGADLKLPEPKSGKTLLGWAADKGSAALVKLALDKGSDPNAKDKYQATALHAAARSGREPIVRLLLEKKANPNAKDKRGETPLHRAAGIGHLEIVRLLLTAGANPREGGQSWAVAQGSGRKL